VPPLLIPGGPTAAAADPPWCARRAAAPMADEPFPPLSSWQRPAYPGQRDVAASPGHTGPAAAVGGRAGPAAATTGRAATAMFAGAQPEFTSPSGFAFASPSPWTSTPAASSWPMSPATPTSGLVGWDAAAMAAFQTPTLTPPMGPEWIADTGATYHTTPNPGILTSVRPPSSSLPSSIMVANDSCLPVTSVGAAGPPGSFRILDVLVAPSLVHNLLSIRWFTADNSCSVEFDSSGLTVKDSTTRRPLLRCDSTGPLCTLRLPHATSSSSSPNTAVVFATTTSSTTWHRRLGQLDTPDVMPCYSLLVVPLSHA
jgi:hypothetical protein